MLETRQEKRDFLIVVLVLGFIFGFDDGTTTFDAGRWLLNLLAMIIFSGMAVLVHQLGHILIANRYGCMVNFRLWVTKRFNLRKRAAKTGIPVGILLSIILALFSSGQLPFAALWSNEVSIDRKYRLGRKYTNITDIESAKIYAAGPVISVLFALLLKPLVSIFPSISSLIYISFAIAVATLIPFPQLAGNHLVFSSFTLWISIVVFVIASILASLWLSSFLSFIIALILTIIAGIIHVYYKMKS